MARWSLLLAAVVALVAVVVASDAGAITSSGSARTRPPTPTERRALEDATLSSYVGDKGILFVRVSLADASYAIVGWAPASVGKGGATVSLLHRSRGHWRVAYDIGQGDTASADGACAVAPKVIVRDLYGYRCSFTWAQLHARRATHAEARLLQAALDRYLRGFSFGSNLLNRACVSRAAPNWAGATGYDVPFVWFQRKSLRWRVTYMEGDQTPRPSHAVLLSLGSCVGYFPSDYYR